MALSTLNSTMAMPAAPKMLATTPETRAPVWSHSQPRPNLPNSWPIMHTVTPMAPTAAPSAPVDA